MVLTMPIRMTFTLDAATIRRRKRLASRSGLPRKVVRAGRWRRPKVEPDPLPGDPVTLLRQLHESSRRRSIEKSGFIWLKFMPIESLAGAICLDNHPVRGLVEGLDADPVR